MTGSFGDATHAVMAPGLGDPARHAGGEGVTAATGDGGVADGVRMGDTAVDGACTTRTAADGACTDGTAAAAASGAHAVAICYVAGTRILTARGEVAVERLQLGDRALALLSQALLPVRWLGHRTLDLRTHPAPALVRPVRIRAGALAEGVPTRDLCVSPGHCLHLDGALVPARHLVNGVSVVQEDPEQVTYWHVELECHDVLLAEGVGAESFLDTGNRADLEEGADVQALHPDFLPRHAAQPCAPVVEQGAALEAVKGRVLARAAAAFSARTTEDPALVLLADGVPVAPCETAGRYYRFVPPEGTRSLMLASRSWVPAQLLSGSTDARTLGVCVRALALDGIAVALDDPRLVAGWDKPERDAGGPQRWTCGTAELPAGLAQVELRLDGYAEYRLPAGREAEAATG